LVGAAESAFERERRKVAREGWGARGKTYFELERLGTPSRWNTLRALRVLRWWEG
jgi:hypothetical protein